MLGYAIRGPLGVPVRMQSLRQVEEFFGPRPRHGFLWHAAKGVLESARPRSAPSRGADPGRDALGRACPPGRGGTDALEVSFTSDPDNIDNFEFVLHGWDPVGLRPEHASPWDSTGTPLRPSPGGPAMPDFRPGAAVTLHLGYVEDGEGVSPAPLYDEITMWVPDYNLSIAVPPPSPGNPVGGLRFFNVDKGREAPVVEFIRGRTLVSFTPSLSAAAQASELDVRDSDPSQLRDK